MKIIFFLLFALFTLNINAQNSFRKASLTTNDNQKKEGYIKTFGEIIPEEIIFKKNFDSESFERLKTKDFNQLNLGNVGFIRKEVSYEPLEKNMLAKKKNNNNTFNLTTKNLLLKIHLKFENFIFYSFYEKGNEYFFIEHNNKIELLKFKKIIKAKKSVKIKAFRRQLFKNFSSNIVNKSKTIGKLKYSKDNLITFFTLYAKNNNYSFKNYDNIFSRSFKNAFNIIPKIGYSKVNNLIKNENESYNSGSKKSNLNFGLDFEYFINSIQKRSSIVFSYTYHLNSKTQSKFALGQGNPENSTITSEYQRSTYGMNYRHYFKVLKNHYFYLSGGFTLENSKGKIDYLYEPTNAYIAKLEYEGTNTAFNFGIGYNLYDFYLEINYVPNLSGDLKALSSPSTNGSWSYERNDILNISLGYSIF